MAIVLEFHPVDGARQVTPKDMESALALLEERLSEWKVRWDRAQWGCILERTQLVGGRPAVTQTMGMYDYGDPPRVGIEGHDEDVLRLLGETLAERCGSQLLRADSGPDFEVLFRAPRRTRASSD